MISPYYEILNVQQGTDEWKQERLKRVTASQVQSLLGICPYQTPLELLKEKLAGRVKAEGHNRYLFDKAHKLEKAAREWVEDDLKIKFPPMVVVSKKYPDLLASLDGFNVEQNIILEAKFIGADALAEVEAGQIKEHHMIQVQSQLLVTRAKKCIYFATSGNGESALAQIEPNLELAERISKAVSDFMNDLREY